MGRAERHPAGGILDAARELVLGEGLRAATVDRIVVASFVAWALAVARSAGAR